MHAWTDSSVCVDAIARGRSPAPALNRAVWRLLSHTHRHLLSLCADRSLILTVSWHRRSSSPTACPICLCRHTDVVRTLLTGGAKPNQVRTDGGATAIIMAGQSGHLDSVQLLAAFGADRQAQAQFPDGKVHTAESIFTGPK